MVVVTERVGKLDDGTEWDLRLVVVTERVG